MVCQFRMVMISRKEHPGSRSSTLGAGEATPLILGPECSLS
jgi:hypothetical protein